MREGIVVDTQGWIDGVVIDTSRCAGNAERRPHSLTYKGTAFEDMFVELTSDNLYLPSCCPTPSSSKCGAPSWGEYPCASRHPIPIVLPRAEEENAQQLSNFHISRKYDTKSFRRRARGACPLRRPRTPGEPHLHFVRQVLQPRLGNAPLLIVFATQLRWSG
jgi:hypothetical protein